MPDDPKALAAAITLINATGTHWVAPWEPDWELMQTFRSTQQRKHIVFLAWAAIRDAHLRRMRAAPNPDHP